MGRRWRITLTLIRYRGTSGLVNEAGARLLFHGGGQRAIFFAVGADQRSDLVQVILRLFTVALFELPQTVILPGLDVVRIGLERALVPDLRELVVAELAVGVGDQVGAGGGVLAAERLQWLDGGGVVVVIVDRGVSGVIARHETGVVEARALVVLLLITLLAVGSRRRRVVVTCGGSPDPR